MRHEAQSPTFRSDEAELIASAVRRHQKAMDNRRLIFGDELFFDPAWFILLDLFAAAIERKATTISIACVASGAPPTTALRYVATLVKRGLVIRSQDKLDARKQLLTLSAGAMMGMLEWVTTNLLAMPLNRREISNAQLILDDWQLCLTKLLQSAGYTVLRP